MIIGMIIVTVLYNNMKNINISEMITTQRALLCNSQVDVTLRKKTIKKP